MIARLYYIKIEPSLNDLHSFHVYNFSQKEERLIISFEMKIELFRLVPSSFFDDLFDKFVSLDLPF